MGTKTPNYNSRDEEIKAYRRGLKAFKEGRTRHVNPYIRMNTKLAQYWGIGWDGEHEKETHRCNPLDETNA